MAELNDNPPDLIDVLIRLRVTSQVNVVLAVRVVVLRGVGV